MDFDDDYKRHNLEYLQQILYYPISKNKYLYATV